MENEGERIDKFGKRKADPDSPCEKASEKASKKASWDIKNTEIFIKLCVQEVKVGNRPNFYFNKKGWDHIVENFEKETTRKYSKSQLKNRWDSLKKDWGLWKSMLKGETGLGWDYIKQTVAASDEWWERKLQKFPNCAKFRQRGIILPNEQDLLFNDVYATGENAWTPNSGILLPNMQEQESDDPIEEEEAEVSRTNDIDRHVLSKKSKALGTSKKGGKIKYATVSFKESLERSVSAFESSNASVSSIRAGVQGCSIPDVLKILQNLPGVQKGDLICMHAVDMFLKHVNREMFVALDDNDTRLLWLKNHFDRSVHP